MKVPIQKDEIFLADVRKAIHSRSSRLWWLGQSGFLVVREGRGLVLDPYLSDSLTRKYAHTDKPHVRLTERVIAPEALAALGNIDLITSSHQHTDHLDAETLLPLLSANPAARLVVPEAGREFARERLGPAIEGRMMGLNDDASVQVGELEVNGVAAAHNAVERDSAGRCRFLGYVLRWGTLTIYHSGDTLWHEALVPSLRRFRIDVALLPINGDRPERRVAGNLDGRQAAQLAKAIGAALVVPCHFHLFEFNTASPDEFVAECKRLEQPFRVLGNGEGMELG